MTKTTRIKASAVAVPRTREEAEALLAAIGTAQREVARIEADMNDRLSTIKTDAEQDAAPFNSSIRENFSALHAWAEAHRDELCPRGLKTAKLASGEICWRQRPPSVRISGKQQKVIEHLLDLGLTGLLREKVEVDKDAVLREPELVKGIKGLTIVSGVEDFVATPFETEIERAEPVLKRVAA